MIKIETKRLLLQNMHGFRLRQRDICILTACGCLGLSRGMDTDGFKDGATYDEIRDCKCLIHIGLQLMLCYAYKAHICFEH